MQTRIAITSAPRDNQTVEATVHSLALHTKLGTEPPAPEVCVFYDGELPESGFIGRACIVTGQVPDTTPGVRPDAPQRGVHNWIRAATWASDADIAVVLEDDLWFSDGWLGKAIRALQDVEDMWEHPILHVHDFWAPESMQRALRWAWRSGEVDLYTRGQYFSAHGAQGIVMRGDSCKALLQELRRIVAMPGVDLATREPNGRRWPQDVAIAEACPGTVGPLVMLFTDPCLVEHMNGTSTWRTEGGPELSRTKRFVLDVKGRVRG